METKISFDKAALLWTARVGGEVIAEADASGHSRTLYLNKLWVKSDYQDRGIATQLLLRVLSDAGQAGYDEIQLLAAPDASNGDSRASLDKDALVRFYGKHGFESMELHQFDSAMRRGI